MDNGGAVAWLGRLARRVGEQRIELIDAGKLSRVGGRSGIGLSRRLRNHVVSGKKRDGMGNGRLFRLRWGRRSVRCHRLLRCDEVGIVGIQPAGQAEEALHMGEACCRIGLCKWCDQEPIGPGLRHHGVRLRLIEQAGALLIQLSGLFGRLGLGQRSVGIGELLLQVIDIRLQREQLVSHGFLLLQRGESLSDLVGVHLRLQVDVDHHDVTVQPGSYLLIEYQHHPGGIAAQFIAGDVQISYDRDAFEIRGHLFQRVLFGLIACQPDGIHSRFPIGHTMLPRGRHDSNVGMARSRPGHDECHIERE